MAEPTFVEMDTEYRIVNIPDNVTDETIKKITNSIKGLIKQDFQSFSKVNKFEYDYKR